MKNTASHKKGSGGSVPPLPLKKFTKPAVRKVHNGWKGAKSRIIRNKKFSRPAGQNYTIARIEGSLPKVHISPQAHWKMWALVQKCAIEIGWLCTVNRRKNGDFLIEDVFVPKQICTLSTTEITADGNAELLQELLSKGRMEDVNRLHCWGHSHVNMAVYASDVDEKQTAEYLEQMDDFFLRLIANKKGELYCTLYLLDENLKLDNSHIVVQKSKKKVRFDKWAQGEIDEKVTQRTFTAGYYNDYGMEYDLTLLTPCVLASWLDCGFIDETLYDLLIGDAESHLKEGGSHDSAA